MLAVEHSAKVRRAATQSWASPVYPAPGQLRTPISQMVWWRHPHHRVYFLCVWMAFTQPFLRAINWSFGRACWLRVQKRVCVCCAVVAVARVGSSVVCVWLDPPNQVCACVLSGGGHPFTAPATVAPQRELAVLPWTGDAQLCCRKSGVESGHSMETVGAEGGWPRPTAWPPVVQPCCGLLCGRGGVRAVG